MRTPYPIVRRLATPVTLSASETATRVARSCDLIPRGDLHARDPVPSTTHPWRRGCLARLSDTRHRRSSAQGFGCALAGQPGGPAARARHRTSHPSPTRRYVRGRRHCREHPLRRRTTPPGCQTHHPATRVSSVRTSRWKRVRQPLVSAVSTSSPRCVRRSGVSTGSPD